MNIRLSIVMGVALLAGCGHGGGSKEPAEPPELSGVFKAGNVMGVHYRTPTRDGLTDASGTFKYLAGETVTFSIGAIQLGSAPGAATITPFTLAGLAPPTTEPALRRELDRAQRTTSAFVRAINIDRFLLALDDDHDPANGIDVRAKTSVLANASLDFNLGIPFFIAKLDKLAPNLTHNLPRWYPVVHLYRAVGIAVPAHVPTDTTTEQLSFSTWTFAIAYNPDGSRKSQDSYDGFEGNTYSQTYNYDVFGRRTASRFVSQPFFGGGYTENERWTFDARGTLTGSVRDRDEGSDGSIENGMTVSHEYGEYNNLLRQQTRQDFGNDGTVDSLDDFRTTYDSRLNAVRTEFENDYGADGTVESRFVQTAEYDANNQLLSQLVEWDELADGTVDSRETWSVTRAAQGAGAVETYQRDEDADGDVDYAITYRWTYDAGRLRTLEITNGPLSAPIGQSPLWLVQTLTYDDDAHVVSEVQSQDWDDIAGFDTTSRTVTTFTDFGSPMRQVTEVDGGNDGVVDSRYVLDYQYGAGGELVGSSNSAARAPDWTPEVTSTVQVTNTLFADGVLALAQHYFEFSYIDYTSVTF